MFIPEVVQVIPARDYTVKVLFHDGKVVFFDAKHLLDKGKFSCLNDIDFFLRGCTVMNHTLAWDLSGHKDPFQCLDIDPLYLYFQ